MKKATKRKSSTKNKRSPDYYANRITFLERESEWGKNLTSKFIKVIHDGLGNTRTEITEVLVAKGALKPIMDKKGAVDITKTAKKLNFAFDGMQKKHLLRKEEIRNGEDGKKVKQTRNCRYSLTNEGKAEYKKKIEPNFRKWVA